MHARGIALVGVLWMLAALSLIVAGMVKVTRQDARTTSVSKQGILADAYGQAAIMQILQRIQVDPSQFARFTSTSVIYQGVPIQVNVVPMNGFVNLNGASPELLSKALRVAAGLAPGQADALAQNVITWRDKPDSRGMATGFDAVEDLLQLPGFGYDLYANIAPLLVVDRRSVTRVNALAATPEVLAVLAGGNGALASQVAQARNVPGSSPDTTRLDAALVDSTSVPRYRLMASLSLEPGRSWLVSRDVDIGRRLQEGLPWRVYGADHRIWSGAAPP